jgi:drug/metabolite transporter (DMT)-like permease
MIFPLFIAIGGYALFSGLWWVLQRRLLTASVPKSVVLFFSGIGTSSLIIASVMLYGWPVFSRELLGLVVLNIVFNIIIAYCYASALARGEASLAVSVTAFAPVLAIATGYFFLGEVPGVYAALGIMITLVGTYVMNVNRQMHGGLWGPLRQIWRERSLWLWYAVGAAVFASLALPIEKKMIGLSNFLFPSGMQLFFGWGIFWGMWALLQKEYRFKAKLPIAQVILLCVGVGVCLAIANAFQGSAYYYGLAASVGALKRLDGPVTILLAALFLKERDIRFRFLGMFIIAAGAALITLDRYF